MKKHWLDWFFSAHKKVNPGEPQEGLCICLTLYNLCLPSFSYLFSVYPVIRTPKQFCDFHRFAYKTHKLRYIHYLDVQRNGTSSRLEVRHYKSIEFVYLPSFPNYEFKEFRV